MIFPGLKRRLFLNLGTFFPTFRIFSSAFSSQLLIQNAPEYCKLEPEFQSLIYAMFCDG